MKSVDNTQKGTSIDLYVLYNIGIALLATPMSITLCTDSEYESEILEKAASFAAKWQVSDEQSFGVINDAFLSWE